MPSVSYQTIKLSTGRHSSPEVGVCVMELASMLAGEPFTDQPESVCPVIASFLRAYNDLVDDSRRQDLYAYASKVVGSTGSAAVQRARAERLAAWALEMRHRRWTRWLLPRWLHGIGVEREPPIDVLGLHAARSVSRPTDERHAPRLRSSTSCSRSTRSARTAPVPTGARRALRNAAIQPISYMGAHLW